jgi:hypothetical protein
MSSSLFKICFVLAFCFSTLDGTSQIRTSGAPGGVKGATQWLVADTLGGKSILSSQIPSKPSLSPPNPRSFGWINHRPSLIMNGTNNLSINLGKEEMNRATFFTVYHTGNTSRDQLIWTVDKNKKTDLVLTTDRVADLEDYRYMNFTDLTPTMPKINIYGQSKSKDSLEITEQTWNIGKIPTSPQLPVSNFSGLIPEIIAFNRVLDREERLRVASYLALKYGITLTEPGGTYLNSRGETIWNGEAAPIYHHNIAGIGRDDASAWLQKIAGSSNYPNLLSLSVVAEPENDHFLLWGDNDLPLSLATKLPGMPALLKREWLITPYGSNPVWETEIVLDTKQVYATIPAKPVYWMLIDSTGTGDFSSAGIQYIKMDKLDEQGFAHFKVSWEKNKAGKSIFTFMVAQDLLLATNVIAPNCTKPESGQLQVKILGGQSPFFLTVTNKSTGRVSNRQIQDNRSTEELKGLSAGKYLLEVTDARQQVYADSFWVNPVEAPNPSALSDAYELLAGKSIQVNASENMLPGITYHWQGPDNFESSSPAIELSQAGVYTLTTTQNGCSYTREIQVNGLESSVFHSEMVYPNPSTGMFNVKIMLNKPAAVNLAVYSEEGRLILSKKASGADHYMFREQLTTNGLYYIVLQSGNSVTTHKLLIVH